MPKVDPVNQKRRHWLMALILQIGIRVRYAIETLGGLKPLFTPLAGYPSKFRPKECPHYDFITQSTFIWIWLMAGLIREFRVVYFIFCKIGIVSLLQAVHDWAANRLAAKFEAAGWNESKREIAIPEYDWKKGNPEEFYRMFVARPHPVVLRGFMKGKKLLKDLNWDTVLKKYGEEDVYLTTKELDGTPGKLKEVNNPKVYLHNSEILFSKYPEIRDLFEYKSLEPYMHMQVGYEQIFVGKEGTGSPFHNASVYNMFYQVDGKKTWWFVDPYDTFLSYPTVLLGKAAGVLMCLWPIQYNKEAFPLFKYCPVYKTELEPGDVLFNPPWWWHSIKNTTPVSVGVASRWHTDGIVGDKLVTSEEDYNIYRTGSLFFMMGHTSWNFLHGILQTPSPRFDEHMSLRETNNRYVHKQLIIDEQGGVEVAGVKAKF